MDTQELAWLQACVAEIAGLPNPGTLPAFTRSEHPAAPSPNGNYGDRTVAGLYSWRGQRPDGTYVDNSGQRVTVASDATPAQVGHELAHYLQDMSGMRQGGFASPDRREVERQAYDVQNRVPFECLDFWGNVKPVEMQKNEAIADALEARR